MKRTFLFSSAADAVTVSTDLHGKAKDFFSFIKGWKWAVSAGSYKGKGTGEITLEQFHVLIQGQESVSRIFCKTLCKTEKFKNRFIFTALSGSKVIHSWVLSHSFNQGAFAGSKLMCG